MKCFFDCLPMQKTRMVTIVFRLDLKLSLIYFTFKILPFKIPYHCFFRKDDDGDDDDDDDDDDDSLTLFLSKR